MAEGGAASLLVDQGARLAKRLVDGRRGMMGAVVNAAGNTAGTATGGGGGGGFDMAMKAALLFTGVALTVRQLHRRFGSSGDDVAGAQQSPPAGTPPASPGRPPPRRATVNNVTGAPPQAPQRQQPRRTGTSLWMNIAVLGQGANGVVYKGINIETGQIVAIKEMLNAAGDRELRREMEVLRQLQHPNLVAIHDFEVVSANHVAVRGQGCCRLVMELCGNGTLIDVMKQAGACLEPRLTTYARQLLLGLQALHEHEPPIVHRDIKPANVLVDQGGCLKIADFGLSRYAHTMRDVTRLAGTPLYLAPESVRGHFSVGSDLWALGATLVQMATNKLPWHGVAPMDNNAALMFFLSNVPADPEARRQHRPAIADDVALSAEGRAFFAVLFEIEHKARGTCRELLRHPWLGGAEAAAAAAAHAATGPAALAAAGTTSGSTGTYKSSSNNTREGGGRDSDASSSMYDSDDDQQSTLQSGGAAGGDGGGGAPPIEAIGANAFP